MVAEFGRRGDVIVAGLNEVPGISCAAPEGVFYAFPNISGTGGLTRTAGHPAPSGRSAGMTSRANRVRLAANSS
jgi:aspartate/methionine/tyrosine aminotransferase